MFTGLNSRRYSLLGVDPLTRPDGQATNACRRQRVLQAIYDEDGRPA